MPGEPETVPTHRQEQPTPIAPALLTVEDAARRLSIGRSRMFELLAGPDPAIPSLTIGPRQRRVRVADLERFVEERLAEDRP